MYMSLTWGRRRTSKPTLIEKENASLKDKTSQLEDFNRRNNINVGGIPEGDGRETWEDVEEKVRQSIIADLGMAAQAVDKLAIDRASRLGKRRQGGSRPVKVAFAKKVAFATETPSSGEPVRSNQRHHTTEKTSQ